MELLVPIIVAIEYYAMTRSSADSFTASGVIIFAFIFGSSFLSTRRSTWKFVDDFFLRVKCSADAIDNKCRLSFGPPHLWLLSAIVQENSTVMSNVGYGNRC